MGSTTPLKPILTELPGQIVLVLNVSGVVPSTITFLVIVSLKLQDRESITISLAVYTPEVENEMVGFFKFEVCPLLKLH